VDVERAYGETVEKSMWINETQDFLRTQLSRVEYEAERHERRIDAFHSEDRSLTDRPDELKQAYSDEREIIRQLIVECQERPLTEVVPHRLRKIRRQMGELSSQGPSNPAARDEFWRVRREQAVLTKLLKEWLR
jgi:chromosome segregation ATPase